MTVRGALKSLDKVRTKVAEKSGFDGESPFLTLKDGDSYVVRFLQELSEDSELYDERRGAIAVVEEHTGQGPEGYKRRAVCTYEEDGRCWACEQTSLPEIGKKWRPRMRFYANVLVKSDNAGKSVEEAKVKILAQGFGDKNVGKLLIDFADDEDYGGVGACDFTLKRTGKGMNDTSYRLVPKAPKPLSEAEATVELKDLSKFIKYVPYEQQADFYAGNEVAADSAEEWLDD